MPKYPRWERDPTPQKSAKIKEHPEPTDWQTLAWQFNRRDKDHPEWGWDKLTHEEFCSLVRDELGSLETMTWAELARASGGRSVGNNHHPIAIEDCCKDARKRLEQLAHLINGMTKGGFGWGNWIPTVVYQRNVQPEYVQQWCRKFAAWCLPRSVDRHVLDGICGTSDMGGWYLGLLPNRCQVPAPHQWQKIRAAIHPPAEMEPERIDADYEPQTDCKRFAVGFETKPDHPSPKPLNVMLWVISVLKPKSVIDPFMGSGTTGVACMQLGRKFIGIEIEPKYFDIACRRIEDAQRQAQMFPHDPPAKQEQLGLGA